MAISLSRLLCDPCPDNPDIPGRVCGSLIDVVEAAEALGCTCPAPFQTPAFLALSVIPKLKITGRGLIDVDEFKVVPLSAD